MNSVGVASLVLYAADIHRTAAFYRALGIGLKDSEHEGGPVHASADLDGVHIAVYAADGKPDRAAEWEAPASSLAGYWVDSLEEAVAAMRAEGAPVLLGHESRIWGCRAVVEDPDGRSVEINQRDHCRPPS